MWWAGRSGQDLIATKKILLDGSNTDSGNSPASTVRGGNIVALDDASGNAYLYDPDDSAGLQIPIGVLEKHQSMTVDGIATDRLTQVLVQGMLKENELIGLDPRAKIQLAGRFLFDRDPTVSAGFLMHPRGVYRHAIDYTVQATDAGLLLVATAAVNFTLPAKQNGLAYRFLQTADANLIVTGSSDVVHKGDASASTVTFSTAGEKIGSHVLVECMYTQADTLKWVVTNLGGTTATVA